MKLSIKIYYALQALITLAQNQPHPPTPLRTIAQEHNISLPFLEQIFVSLRKAGIVTSTRGKDGGFLLKQSPQDISCYNVITALQGNLSMLPQDTLPHSALTEYFKNLETILTQNLQTTTLEHLTQEEKKIKNVTDFTI